MLLGKVLELNSICNHYLRKSIVIYFNKRSLYFNMLYVVT